MGKIDKSFESKFWSKVEKSHSCWFWIGRRITTGLGYGQIDLSKKKAILAHRASYEINIGKIPERLCVLHKCDNPICVRPSHLFLGTQKDNVRDMFKKRRNASVLGEKNPNSILNKRDVLKLKSLLALKKFSYRELALRFGVSYGTINNIKSGYAWKNI